MISLFLLAAIWTFMICFQTKSIVKSQYLLSVASEIALCVCWFVSLKLIIADKFSITSLLVYTSGCVLGIILGIWLHGKIKRRV